MSSSIRAVPFSSPLHLFSTGSSSNSGLMYEFGPAHPLPTLDLSLSLKSRFFSRRALTRLNKFVSKRATISLAGFVALISYFLTIIVPAEPARYFAFASFVLWMPSVIAAFGLFRYEIVKLFLGTYDFWFAKIVNASTFLLLGIMMDDARAVVLIGACLGVQVNVMIDANLHAVKVWTFLNIVGVATHSITWFSVFFMIIDKLRVFPRRRLQGARPPVPSVLD